MHGNCLLTEAEGQLDIRCVYRLDPDTFTGTLHPLYYDPVTLLQSLFDQPGITNGAKSLYFASLYGVVLPDQPNVGRSSGIPEQSLLRHQQC